MKNLFPLFTLSMLLFCAYILGHAVSINNAYAYEAKSKHWMASERVHDHHYGIYRFENQEAVCYYADDSQGIALQCKFKELK